MSEDDELLKRAFRDVKPLKRRQPARVAAPKTAAKLPPGRRAKKAAPNPAPVLPSLKKPELPELTMGAAVGVDIRTVRKLKRGKMGVDARLDLHGHTQDAAYNALSRFLARAQDAGHRTVLVITGKSGVLRGQVPRWLNAAPNRSRVLSFAQARSADGGAGALYVLLKKLKAQ
jgi:DNA-nicking Smr family endonuclease